MTDAEILRKAESNVGLTVDEIKRYQQLVKPQKHIYGKYGTLAKKYLEEYNVAKYWALAGDLPEYLHGIDRQAERMYEVMYAKLSKLEQYKKTGDFLKNLQIETGIKNRIEEEILNKIVYV